jgi:hypothetical protein
MKRNALILESFILINFHPGVVHWRKMSQHDCSEISDIAQGNASTFMFI